MDGLQIGPSAVRLAQPVPVERIPGFAEGLVSVQDAAAQLAAPLLDVHAGMRVLDACAAPGGNPGHILRRLQLNAALKTGDASLTDWWDGRPCDRILADVPCTASGIVRRHPDF